MNKGTAVKKAGKKSRMGVCIFSSKIGHHLEVECLIQISTDFFKAFGTEKLLGTSFFENLDRSEDVSLFESLEKKCGYENNPIGFFHALFSGISGPGTLLDMNGVRIPVLYLYHLLESVMPGNSTHTIKTANQLEQTASVRIEDKEQLQQVMDQYPVRLSDHVIRQSLVSRAVAHQYLPATTELDPEGHIITFDGHFKKGLLEQMYQNRVIFLLDMRCPVYCRFCFRKHKSTRKERIPTPEDVIAAADHVKTHSLIKEILITGGEPLLNKANLEAALNALTKIDHVKTIRIATRSIAYYPHLFLKNSRAYIRYLLEKNATCLDHGKRLEIGAHFVHPDEVSVQSLDIISDLVKNGIPVYVQTPFLNGLNTSGKTLGRLFNLLRQAGAEIYYIFTPCSPIHGTKAYWTPVFQAIEAARFLRANVSDRCIPKLCTATPLGKIEWHTSGWAVEIDAADPAFTWIRTPYTSAYFNEFIPDNGPMPDFRVNNEGTLDARFRLTMGEDSLLKGNRSLNGKDPQMPSPVPSLEDINAVRSRLLALQWGPSLSKTPTKWISRVHKTRVEMALHHEKEAVEYIKRHPDISDVVIHWGNDISLSMEKTHHLVQLLKPLSHIVSIRLCCKQFTASPEVLAPHVETISQWCDFSVANPVRIEMETWFLLPCEIQDMHGRIAKAFMAGGVAVYANVPLIKRINDHPETIVTLAHNLRDAAIDFHHLYVSGLGIQNRFNKDDCVDKDRIIDIASQVRKQCSGREIPLYIVQTISGESDFGSDIVIHGHGGVESVRRTGKQV